MTWLDEIEKETEQRGMQSEWLKDSAFNKADSRILRMARVIRELVKIVVLQRRVPIPQMSMSEMRRIKEQILSPDAKEIVNEEGSSA